MGLDEFVEVWRVKRTDLFFKDTGGRKHVGVFAKQGVYSGDGVVEKTG